MYEPLTDEQKRQAFNAIAVKAREPFMPPPSVVSAEKLAVEARIEQRRSSFWASKAPGHREAFEAAVDDFLARAIQEPTAAVVHRTYNLEKILDDGRLKSQFETNSSEGSLDQRTRALSETVWFGVEESAPIYGALEFEDLNQSVGSYYGNVSLYLKREALSRTTFTFGDSLGLYRSVTPGSPGDSKYVDTPEYRAGVVSPSNTRGQNADAMWDEVRQDLDNHDIDYIEAQVHGGVTLGDIEKVVFLPGQTPSKSVIDKLEANGIRWEVQP